MKSLIIVIGLMEKIRKIQINYFKKKSPFDIRTSVQYTCPIVLLYAVIVLLK